MLNEVPPKWLFDPVDIGEIESAWLDKPGPYGVSREAWIKLKSQMVEGDDIRAFSAPADYWENLAGRAGYALVRDGKVVASIVTIMN
jgi:hypothetical protein